ncbi:MAG: TonB-dependent receptor, partial [Kangiellaceae bacterium]|nr:TonB-dependent receptor [Kangiellaceae bacterium]
KVKLLQSDSDYEGKFVSYVGGFSNEDNDLVLVAELQEYTALFGKDFEPGSQLTLSDAGAYSFPGTYITQDASSNLIATPGQGCVRSESADEYFVDVAGNVCVNDWAADRQLLPENERKSLAAKWSRYISDSTIYSSLSFNQIDTTSDVPFGLVAADFFVAQDNQFNPINQDMLLLRGFSETGLQTIETEAQNLNFVVGLEGMVSEYDFDISLNHSLTKVDELYSEGWMHRDSAGDLVAAVNNGTINPFEPLTSEQIDSYTSQFNHQGESEQTSILGRLSGELTEWDSGIVYFASGIEFRKESIEDTSDQAILDGEVVGLGSSSAKGDRDVSALFAEVILPATEDIEFNVAVRFDDYSDFGSSVNPKVSMKYRPSELILLRASYGTGFRAPNLFELYTDEVTGSVGDVPFIQVANSDLEAETSESFNFGVVFDIDERFMASFDFWKIEVEDMITNLGVKAILTEVDENDNLIYSDLIVTNPDNSIAYVIHPYLNLDSQMAQGIDISARLSFTKNAELQINISHLAELTQTTNSTGIEQNIEGTYLYPENKVNVNLILGTDSFKHVLSAYYTAEHGDETFTVDGYFKADYQLSYTIGDHRFNLMVANLFDEEPPVNELGQWPYFEQRMYSPLGRNASLSWTYDF